MIIKDLPFTALFKNGIFVLVDVAPLFEYVNNQKTDNITGTKYTVVEMSNFDKFSVKVPTTTPKISKDFLENAKERIYVRFIDGLATPYVNGRSVAWTFSAKEVEIVKKPTDFKGGINNDSRIN